MSKQITIKLSSAEIGHVLNLIENNDLDVIYYGDPRQYWTRSERIKSKLEITQHLSTK